MRLVAGQRGASRGGTSPAGQKRRQFAALHNARFAAAVFLCFIFAATSLSAASRTWTGASATSGNWSTAANWDTGAPTAGDILNFPETGARKTSNTNNLAAGTAFSTINLFGGGYRLRGNSVTVSNYVSAGTPAGTNTVDLDISAAGPGVGLTLRSFASNARLILNGDLNLNARALTTEGPGDYIIGGVISGSGGIFKDNTGDLSLSGSGANTFTGTTRVNAGILRLNRFTSILGGSPGLQVIPLFGTTAIPGDLVIGTGTGGLTADIVVLDRDNQIANTSDVTVNGSGSLELSDENDTIGSLTLTAGFVTTGAGLLTLGGPVTVNAGTEDAVINGRLDLGAGTARLFNVVQGAELTVNAVIDGGAGISLVKSNRGTLTLTSSNLFDGPVDIVGGTLSVAHGSALGTTNGPTRISLGTLALLPGLGVGEPLESPGPSGQLELVSGSASWVGNVQFNDTLNIYVPTNAVLTINGLMSGPAGWFKYGPGTLQFKTAYTNTYAGTGTVREGDLILDGVFHQPVISGPLIIGYTNDAPGRERVSYIKQHQIADTVPITINRSGVLALQFVDDTVGPITLNGGAIETGSGTLTLNGDILANATNATASVSGQLSLGGVTRTIYTLGHSNTPDLLISASILDGAAAAGFDKVGEGELLLTASNTFTGPVFVNDGQLILQNAFALGATNGGAFVNGDALLTLRSNIHVPREPLTLNGAGLASLGALLSQFGTNSWAGDIVLWSNAVVNVPASSDLFTLAGAITSPGAAALTKIGDGTLVLGGTAANAFGPTFVNAGRLDLAKPAGVTAVPGALTVGDGAGAPLADAVRLLNQHQVADTSEVTVTSSGWLNCNHWSEQIGSLAGPGLVTLGGGFLTLGGNQLSRTFSGVLSNAPGANGLAKVGLGTQTLAGSNLFTGTANVAGGTLRIDGWHNLSMVQVQDGATLGGTGLVRQIAVLSGGNLSPGQLRVSGPVTFQNANSVCHIELNGLAPGLGYDQLHAGDAVQLGDSGLHVSLGTTFAAGDYFTIVDKTSPGPVSGIFAGLPEGSVFTVSNQTFRISYTGGDGNDVVLTRVPVSTNRISSIRAVTSERMQLLGQGVPGASYVLEAATHLNAPIPWTPVATNTADALGLYEFIDPFFDQGAPLYPQRFFRVKEP